MQAARVVGSVRHRLELAVAVLLVGRRGHAIAVAVVQVETLELVHVGVQVVPFTDRGLAELRLGRTGVQLTLVARIVPATFLVPLFQERVLLELLFDARLQVQGGQLQDLHRLDHLGRLQESLFQTGRLMESEAHGRGMGWTDRAALS